MFHAYEYMFTYVCSNLFQGNERLIVSLIAGAFAASSSLFTFMRLLYDEMEWDMHSQFLGYSGICAMVSSLLCVFVFVVCVRVYVWRECWSVDICVCVCVCVMMRVRVYRFVCSHLCLYMCARVSLCVCWFLFASVHVCLRACWFLFASVYVYVCIYIIYIYIYTHIFKMFWLRSWFVNIVYI